MGRHEDGTIAVALKDMCKIYLQQKSTPPPPQKKKKKKGKKENDVPSIMPLAMYTCLWKLP